MTNDRVALAEFIEKGSDADLLREMIGFVAQRLMDVDVESLCGAGYGERLHTTCRRKELPPSSHRFNKFRDIADLELIRR